MTSSELELAISRLVTASEPSTLHSVPVSFTYTEITKVSKLFLQTWIAVVCNSGLFSGCYYCLYQNFFLEMLRAFPHALVSSVICSPVQSQCVINFLVEWVPVLPHIRDINIGRKTPILAWALAIVCTSQGQILRVYRKLFAPTYHSICWPLIIPALGATLSRMSYARVANWTGTGSELTRNSCVLCVTVIESCVLHDNVCRTEKDECEEMRDWWTQQSIRRGRESEGIQSNRVSGVFLYREGC
jgi:hypothetical protein